MKTRTLEKLEKVSFFFRKFLKLMWSRTWFKVLTVYACFLIIVSAIDELLKWPALEGLVEWMEYDLVRHIWNLGEAVAAWDPPPYIGWVVVGVLALGFLSNLVGRIEARLRDIIREEIHDEFEDRSRRSPTYRDTLD